jgi:aminocarboxymuconate-semialdehyde decarboxylase
MRIVDSHFHWRPRSILEDLCERTGYPRAERDGNGGYFYVRKPGLITSNSWAAWYDLDAELAHMDTLGRGVIDVVNSIGPFSIHYSELPVDEGREAALVYNEHNAEAQRKHAGRFWGTAAVPLVDTATAIDVMDHAILKLGLVGVNVPCSIGDDPRIDAERLEPFYDRVEELGVPILLHPTDAMFFENFNEGYGGALHLSLGRVVEVSVAAARLIFSGIMERHPKLKVVMSHTGGALPYQAGRLDKNGKQAKLAEPPSVYLKRMYTDTVSPHSLGMKFAIDFFGADHVMYGTDYPCWMPADALRLLDEIGIPQDDQLKIFSSNARELFNLRVPANV